MLVLLLGCIAAVAQETTGGLQGTVRDPKGAVVPKAEVTVTGTSLAGAKKLNTDNNGYYRFANLPPGVYTLTVKSAGFSTLQRDGITIDMGKLPTLDVELKVGGSQTVVEVTATAPVIDVTTTQNTTSVNEAVINDVPHGRSFQSVIQFAPSARNEPLAGQTGGTGGSSPGSSGNGLGFGYSVAGASDSENAYLIEGQDTENITGGYSKANVPFEFIQEVQIKSSGIEAEHGGALGGVVNVVMKKGSNQWHGEVFTSIEKSGVDGSPNAYLRDDPSGNLGSTGDVAAQIYQPKKDSYTYLQPGLTLGGPLLKDRVWFFAGFAPEIDSTVRKVDFGNTTPNSFTQNTNTYYGTLRLDATLTQSLRVYASWLSQYARRTGAALPRADSTQGLLNISTLSPISNYAHEFGFTAPNQTFNVGADYTINPRLVSTTRFGYFFENYRDFGYPTSGVDVEWETSGVGALDNYGNALPSALQQDAGAATTTYNANYTRYNANKHHQFNQDLAWFKTGWLGTHNFKFGYQLNHLFNTIQQGSNVPQVQLYLAQTPIYSVYAGSTFGQNNCALLAEVYGNCYGQYGWALLSDFVTYGKASDWNHAFFVQDAWTLGKGLTINAGIRVEKEDLPAPSGANVNTIHFGWGDKIAPRVGVAWDPRQNGKMKVFGSYGVVNDVMKLLVAETSWGGQLWDTCAYPLGPDGNSTFTTSDMTAAFSNGRFCPTGLPNVGASFTNGTIPASLTDSATGVSLVNNANMRPWEPVAPSVKPYRQHESVLGFDYQITKGWAFEARWDRRRLDHILEDAALLDPSTGNEMFAIVNPGEGVNKTMDGYATWLGSLGEGFGVPGETFNASAFGSCPSCSMPKAVRNYDGVEFRLTKTASKHWQGMFSYTWSRLTGNYSGLTTTDQSDGGSPGRNSPDTSRAFDEPYFYYTAAGKSSNGVLPTDRPSTFKGYVYYTQPWSKHQSTTLGLFQVAYQGSPVSTYANIGGTYGDPSFSQYVFGHGRWADVSVDDSGNVTLGRVYDRRTPWFMQSDFNIQHEIRLDDDSPRRLAVEATVANLFNQHAVTAYYQQLDSNYFGTAIYPGGTVSVGNGAAAYKVFETGYNLQQSITNSGMILNSWYGKPFSYQQARSLRFKIRFSF